MKKIWIYAGAVLFFVFLLFSIVFLGGFKDFADLLSNKSENIQNYSETDFLGSWVTNEKNNTEFIAGISNRYTFSINNEGTFGGLSGKWNISKNILTINCSDNNQYSYSFKFSEDKMILYFTMDSVEIKFYKL